MLEIHLLNWYFLFQGIISFLVVTESVKEDDPSDVQYSIHAIRNTLYTDACFLKVIGKTFEMNVLCYLLAFISLKT